MIAALNQAAGQAGLGGFVKGHVRDLARRPLRVDELKPYDAVLLDPPRSGAAHQAESLATGWAGPDRLSVVQSGGFSAGWACTCGRGISIPHRPAHRSIPLDAPCRSRDVI